MRLPDDLFAPGEYFDDLEEEEKKEEKEKKEKKKTSK